MLGAKDGDREAMAEVALATGGVVGGADDAAEGGAEDADAAVVDAGGALWVTVADAAAKLGAGLELA